MLTIGIDLGTSGIKAVLLQEARQVMAIAYRPVAVSIPQVGHSEQEAEDWVSAVFACLDELAAAQPGRMGDVAGIGLSGQMLSALLLDADLRPLHPAMLWNDQRAVAECGELLARVPGIGRRTNGTPDPGITAPKLMWLAQHEPRVFGAARMLLLTKDYVRLALTGDLATDPTDAGGTQLFDVAAGTWAADICTAIGWDEAHLPPVLPSWAAAGGLRPVLAARWGMKAGLPVATGAGDNMGSTLGAGAARPGDAVLSVGTSGVANLVDGAFHPGPEVAVLTSAHAVPGAFLSMGVVMSATAALDFTARLTGCDAARLAGEAEALDMGRMADAPVFLPCLNGIRTPANQPGATGRIEGLHPGVDRAAMGYATLEGVAFQFADCIAAQRSIGVAPERFMAVGGGTRSALWMRLLATVLNVPLVLPAGADIAGPSGAARLAMVAAGAPVETLGTPPDVRETILPDQGLAPLLAVRKARFDRLAAAI